MESTRPRAVFSNEDFRLLKTAVMHYVRTGDDPESVKYANLLHRLGRVAPAERPASNSGAMATDAG